MTVTARLHFRQNLTLCLALAIAVPGAALAQAPINVPRPPPPPVDLQDRILPPTAPNLSPRTQPPPPEARRGPGEGQRVAISTATVQGNTAVETADLRPFLSPIEGQTVALSEIEQTRLALLGAYRRAGYPFVSVAAALVPVPAWQLEHTCGD